MDLFWLGGEGPKDIPQWACIYLVTTLRVPPENLTGLLSVQKVGFWEGKLVTFVRLYHPLHSEEAMPVKDFTSLDEHPGLILYEGYQENVSGRVFLERRARERREQVG